MVIYGKIHLINTYLIYNTDIKTEINQIGVFYVKKTFTANDTDVVAGGLC